MQSFVGVCSLVNYSCLLWDTMGYGRAHRLYGWHWWNRRTKTLCLCVLQCCPHFRMCCHILSWLTNSPTSTSLDISSFPRTKEIHSGTLSSAGKKRLYLWPVLWIFPLGTLLFQQEWKCHGGKRASRYVASLWEHCIIVWSPFINWSEVLYSLSKPVCSALCWNGLKRMLTVL